MTKRIREIRAELQLMATYESMKLWRLARRAEEHRVSPEVIHEIRREANKVYTNYVAYPDRLLNWKTEYKFKYAFKY